MQVRPEAGGGAGAGALQGVTAERRQRQAPRGEVAGLGTSITAACGLVSPVYFAPMRLATNVASPPCVSRRRWGTAERLASFVPVTDPHLMQLDLLPGARPAGGRQGALGGLGGGRGAGPLGGVASLGLTKHGSFARSRPQRTSGTGQVGQPEAGCGGRGTH